MKKLLVIMSIMIFASVVYAEEKGPETIKMTDVFNVPKTTKKVVEFPHAFHQTKNECSECHLDPEGGDGLKNINTGKKLEVEEVSGIMNPVHKNFCWACHTKKNVPQGKSCNKCHN